MTEIKLHNTATRKKEVFTPIDPKNVRMYVCGPTVYDRAHLGNARPVVVFDVLFRLLRHLYGEKSVTYVRNFTDVDDKINAKAAETGRAIRDITDETIEWYHDDMEALGTLRPTQEPRATEFIPQMVAMIEELIAKDAAYEAEGHVLFAVDKYDGYGQLSGRSIDDMIAGARVEVAPYKRNPMDFVLWKPSDKDTPGWDSPWGRGRPGWHIECSAMARDILGERFDIHGGGIDLQFPHHENEIAQSKCLCGESGFAQVWLHNEMLQVEGKKMSKSLGNFFTVRDLLDKGVPGEVIRFVLLSTHYSKPMDWTERKRDESESTLRNWHRLIADTETTGNVDQGVVDALADDLNTTLAITRLHELAKSINANPTRDCHFEKSVFLSSAQALGLLSPGNGKWVQTDGKAILIIERLIEERKIARDQKKFPLADTIRHGLADSGVQLKDIAGKTEWFVSPVGISGPLNRGYLHYKSTGDLTYLNAAAQKLESIGVAVSVSDNTGIPKTSGWVGEVNAKLPIMEILELTLTSVVDLK